MLEFQKLLKDIYQRQNKITPLIQGLEDELPQQPLEEYYVNIKLSTRQGHNQEKIDLPDLETIFDPLPNENIAGKKAIHKLLIIGGAGTGKSTLMQYMAYKWSKGELWIDKFDYVYRVSLKTLLNRGWEHHSGRQDESSDLLKRLVYFHLLAEFNSEGRQRYKLEDIPWKQKKTLLLLDGFDEVAHEVNGVYKTVFEDIFDHENIIMTSRPNAVSKEMAGRFDREIENTGFSYPGMNQYLTKYFENDKKKGQILEDYLRKNYFLKEVCHIPVIIAMLCFIWSEGDSNQAFQNVSNMSDLYHQMVDHLGFRYYAKQTEKSEQERYELLSRWKGGKIPLDELLVLQHLAYKGMTGGGIEVPDDQRTETLIIPGIKTKGDKLGLSIQSSINYLSDELKRDMPTINKVYKYGLLKPEGILVLKRAGKDPSETDLQSHNFSFIHLSFQEFLTAQYLAEKLMDNQDQESIANFIARHRNEPRYLNTLKFMAGIFSTTEGDKVEQGIQTFWDAAMCNPDGILEFGEEMKVILLMHLLSQTNKEDLRIPNMDVAVRLIDSVVLRDLPGWSSQLRESDYLSENMKDALIEYFVNKNKDWLPQKILDLQKASCLKQKIETNVTAGEMMEIISVMIHKFSKEQQYQIFFRVFEIFKGSQAIEWQCKKKSIEAIIEINRKIDLYLDESSQKQLASLLLITAFDYNFTQISLKAIKELAHKHQNSLFVEIFKNLLKEEFAKLHVGIDETKLLTIADLIRVTGIGDSQLIETVIKNLIPLLSHSLWSQRESALNNIIELAKTGCKNDPQLISYILNSLAPVAKDDCSSLQNRILEKMTELTKICWRTDPRLIRETFNHLDLFLKDHGKHVTKTAPDCMVELTKLGWKNDHQLIRDTLRSLIPIFKDSYLYFRRTGEESVIELVRMGCMDDTQLIKDTLDNLTPLLDEPSSSVKKRALDSIIELIEIGGINDTLLFQKIFACLSSYLEKSDFFERESAVESIQKFVRISCKDNTQLSRDFLKHLASVFKNSHSTARRACPRIVTELININECPYNQLIKDLLSVFTPLSESFCDPVRDMAFDCIIQLMGINEVQLAQNILKRFTSLLENPDLSIRNEIIYTIIHFIEKSGNVGLQLAGDILKNSDWDISYIVSKARENLNEGNSNHDDALDKLNKQIKNYDLNFRHSKSGNIKGLMGVDDSIEAQMFSDLLQVLIPFLKDSRINVKNSASETIITLLKMSGDRHLEVLKDLFEALKSSLQNTDAAQRKSAFENLIALLKISSFNTELVENFWDGLVPLLNNSEKEVKLLILRILSLSIRFFPKDGDILVELVRHLLDILNPLLQDPSLEIQSSASLTLWWLIQACHNAGAYGDVVYKLINDFFQLTTHPHSGIRQLASSSIQELVKTCPQDETEFATKILNKFKPLLQDQSIYIADSDFEVILNLIERYGSSDAQIIRDALTRLIPFSKASEPGIQKAARNHMTELTKLGWRNDPLLIRETLNIWIPLFKETFPYFRNFRGLLSCDIIELAKFGRENDAQLIRYIFNRLSLLLSESDRDIQTVVSDCMTELVKIGSEKDTQLITDTLNGLTPLFQSSDCHLQEPVSTILIEVMNTSPQFDHTELCQVLFPFLTSLLKDSNWGVRSSASRNLIKLMKLNNKNHISLVRDAIKISIELLQDSDQGVACISSGFLERIFLQILLKNPTDLTQYFNHYSKRLRDILISGLFHRLKNFLQSFELMQQFFKDPKSSLIDRTILEKLLKQMKRDQISQDIDINLQKLQKNNLSNAEFSKHLSILKSLLIIKLNQVGVLKGPQIIELAMVITGKEKIPEDDSDHKKLIETTKEVLNIQINYLNDDGFKWIHDNHEKLISLSPETTKSFDRKVCIKLLEHEKMSPLEEDLLIKFIKQGLTTSLTRDGEIIFEGRHHRLRGDNIEQTLEKIAKTILGQQQDVLALQYKEHKPIFIKSKGGMKEAAVNIREVKSIVDRRFPIQNNYWLLTILNSSYSNIKILEKRTVFGDHFLYHLTNRKQFIFYPNERPELNDIFGSEVHGEAFQGQILELTDEVGQQLFESRDPTQIYRTEGKLLSKQKYFQQELLDGGCEDRNKDVEQELEKKLNDHHKILEDQLSYLNSEAQRESIREYYQGFVSTFSATFTSSQAIVAGGVAIDTGTDYFNLANLFIQLSSLDPFGIAPMVSEGLDSIRRHLKTNEIKNKAIFIKEIAPDTVEFYDLVCRIALNSIWQQDYTRIIFTARDDHSANHEHRKIKQFVLGKFDELKNKTKQYQCLRNMFLNEIKRTPAFKLGVNDANRIMTEWIQFNQSHTNIHLSYSQKNEKIAQIGRFIISQKLQQNQL